MKRGLLGLLVMMAGVAVMQCRPSTPAFLIHEGEVEVFPVNHDSIHLRGRASDYFVDLVERLGSDSVWVSLRVNSDQDLNIWDSLNLLGESETDQSLWKYDFGISTDEDARKVFEEHVEVLKGSDPHVRDTIWIDPAPVHWDAWFVVDPTRSRVIACSPVGSKPPYVALPDCEEYQ